MREIQETKSVLRNSEAKKRMRILRRKEGEE